ncbi:MAG: inositol monophosphatase [Planctomycetia bacterium]|nr:inositol monophosphatase [Planctomycetia bacterium]
MSEYVEICESAARAGGKVLLDYWGRCKVREKGPADLVTEADEASQEAIFSLIRRHFPDHGLLGEEGKEMPGRDDRHRWIVDPLDGTTNYVHGVPQFAVSVALEEDGRIVAGAVFDPVLKECFTAEMGKRVRLNGSPIRVSRVVAMEQALVVASFPPRVERADPEVRRFINVLVTTQSLRRTGSAAINLSYVACGRFDGYWATTCKAWDVAAGILLVREAGGMVTDLSGGEVDLMRPKFLSSCGQPLHDRLLVELTRQD